MTATIIPLYPDRFLPLKFEMPPAEAIEAHEDYRRATSILEFAQRARNEVFQRGEPLPKAKRELLMDLKLMIEDLTP